MKKKQAPSRLAFLEDQRGKRDLRLSASESDIGNVLKTQSKVEEKRKEKAEAYERRKRKSDNEIGKMFMKGNCFYSFQ